MLGDLAHFGSGTTPDESGVDGGPPFDGHLDTWTFASWPIFKGRLQIAEAPTSLAPLGSLLSLGDFAPYSANLPLACRIPGSAFQLPFVGGLDRWFGGSGMVSRLPSTKARASNP